MAGRLSIEWSTVRFNRFVNNFAKATKANGAVVLRKFSADLLTRIVARSPVDTGRFRAGWAAAGDALGVHVPRGVRGGTDGFYEEDLTSDRMSVRIVNDVPYGIYLEYGWSKQAPLGMVRISMAELRSGQGISSELMDELSAQWEQTPGRDRYRAQRMIMGPLLGGIKDMPLNRPNRNVSPRPRRK